MRKPLSVAVASVGIGLAFLAFAAEGVVARVNGVAITSKAVSDRMTRLGAGKGHGAEARKDEGTLRKEALDGLIFEELAYQKAKAVGLSADPEEVEKRLEDLRAKMGGAEGLEKALAKEMLTETDLRADIERDIVLRRIYAKEVTGKVSVPEDAVAREYEREKGKYAKPEKVVVDDIVFFLKTDERESVERAGEIRRKVLEDADRDPRRLEPDGTFIVHETVVHPEKQKEIYEAAVKMKPGEVSGIIEAGGTLHIIKLKTYSPMKQLTLDEVRGALQQKLLAQASQERRRQWDAELRQGAEIEIMDDAKNKP